MFWPLVLTVFLWHHGWRPVFIVALLMAAIVGSVWLLLAPGLDLAIRLWESRPLWMQPRLMAARLAVDSTTIDALTMANLDLTERCKALDAEVCALRAIDGNKTDTPDAAFRDALRDRDAAVLLAQVETERRVEAERKLSRVLAEQAGHPSAMPSIDDYTRVVGAAVRIVEADDTPAHGMPRPRRIIGRLG